jgi:hypothetical protein
VSRRKHVNEEATQALVDLFAVGEKLRPAEVIDLLDDGASPELASLIGANLNDIEAVAAIGYLQARRDDEAYAVTNRSPRALHVLELLSPISALRGHPDIECRVETGLARKGATDTSVTVRLLGPHARPSRQDGGAAVVDTLGRREWFDLKGQRDRHGGRPAIDDPARGVTEYWVGDKRHRADGPAAITPRGYQYFDRGVCTRADGPAVEIDGNRMWLTDGKLHRTDGPAIERADGTHEFWTDGEQRAVHAQAMPARRRWLTAHSHAPR